MKAKYRPTAGEWLQVREKLRQMLQQRLGLSQVDPEQHNWLVPRQEATHVVIGLRYGGHGKPSGVMLKSHVRVNRCQDHLPIVHLLIHIHRSQTETETINL